MRWTELDTAKCPVARAMSIIGDRWTILIVRDCLRSVTRFEEFDRRLGRSRAIVADRLAHLVERGVLMREAYKTHPAVRLSPDRDGHVAGSSADDDEQLGADLGAAVRRSSRDALPQNLRARLPTCSALLGMRRAHRRSRCRLCRPGKGARQSKSQLKRLSLA